MKYLRKFENFSKDGVEADGQTYPKYNPVVSLNAKKYVEGLFSQGLNQMTKDICKEMGIDAPKSDEELEKVKEMAIKYFTENPERMKKSTSEMTFKTVPVRTDPIPKTNNIGGVYHESKKPLKGDDGVGELLITKEQMRLFRRESPLIKLINNDKVSLHDGVVYYNLDDEKTIKILDIFFEMGGVNESYGDRSVSFLSKEELDEMSLEEIERYRIKFLEKNNPKDWHSSEEKRYIEELELYTKIRFKEDAIDRIKRVQSHDLTMDVFKKMTPEGMYKWEIDNFKKEYGDTKYIKGIL